MSEALVKTEGGILVPQSAIQRKQRVMPASAWTKLRRCVTEMTGESIRTLFVCADCSTPIELLVLTDVKPTPVLRCQCSDRVVR